MSYELFRARRRSRTKQHALQFEGLGLEAAVGRVGQKAEARRDLQMGLKLGSRAARDPGKSSKLPVAQTTRTLGDVCRDAVRGPPQLAGESVALVGGEVSGGLVDRKDERLRLPPYRQLREIAHEVRMSQEMPELVPF
jgi:hypothetical protein